MAKLLISIASFLLLIALSSGETLVTLGRVNVNEWFSIKIEPKLFNLTLDQPNQFEYRFSLKNYPDLPSWLHYMYSTEYNSGFLYGTPPETLGGHEVRDIYIYEIFRFVTYKHTHTYILHYIRSISICLL